MVKVYVELVWDIHFPGKLTREGERKDVRGKNLTRIVKNTAGRKGQEKKYLCEIEAKSKGTCVLPPCFYRYYIKSGWADLMKQLNLRGRSLYHTFRL